MLPVHVVKHLVLSDILLQLRDQSTAPDLFREKLAEASWFLAKDAMELGAEIHPQLNSERVILVPILRAGLGLVPGFSKKIPQAPIHHLGLRRNEQTLEPEPYLINLPRAEILQKSRVIVLDPMLATGGSAHYALQLLKERGAKWIDFACLLCAPEGVAKLQVAHPDVKIFTASIDQKLDHRGYIVPGLGDAGDRQFGTFD